MHLNIQHKPQTFSESYEFKHIASTHGYSLSNGKGESAVKLGQKS